MIITNLKCVWPNQRGATTAPKMATTRGGGRRAAATISLHLNITARRRRRVAFCQLTPPLVLLHHLEAVRMRPRQQTPSTAAPPLPRSTTTDAAAGEEKELAGWEVMALVGQQ